VEADGKTARPMTDPERSTWLADRLGSARADAGRIVRELLAHGQLAPDQGSRLQDEVELAIEHARELVAQALAEPRRLLASLRGTPAGAAGEEPAEDELRGRLDAIEERLTLLEDRAIHGRVRHGGESD
jgi:hypothetical protein